jgi:hypothetical protein
VGLLASREKKMRDEEHSLMRVADIALEKEILARMNSRICGDVSVVMEMQEKQDISSQQSIIFILYSQRRSGRKRKQVIPNYKC